MHRQPTAKELSDLGVTCVAEGNPIPSVKNGAIMYNFQGRGSLAGHEVKIGGNTFLTGMHVDDATRKAYTEAKQAQKLALDAKTVRK